MGQIARRQRHVVLDGAIDVIASSQQSRAIGHGLHIRPELGNALRGLAEGEGEVGEVVDMGLEELAAHGEHAIVAPQVLLDLVCFQSNDGLQNVRLSLHHEALLFREAGTACAKQLGDAVEELDSALDREHVSNEEIVCRLTSAMDKGFSSSG